MAENRYLCYPMANYSFYMQKTDTSKPYSRPVVRIIPLVMENALCGSPVPGGNEDIGYDDWD